LKATQEEPDLIILDFALPDIGGFELLTKAQPRREDKRCSYIRGILDGIRKQ